MFEHISAIAVTVVSGALLGVGLGMIAVGNRSRKTAQMVEGLIERCKTHGLPTSDIPKRLTTLEADCMKFREFAEARQMYIGRLEALESTVATRVKVGERGLIEMRDGNKTLLKRIDTLDDKMTLKVEKVRDDLLKEIRRVNGKIK